MVTCAVKGCRNNSGRKAEVRFARFPKNKLLLKIWLSRCGIGNGSPKQITNTYMFICSKHFKEDEFTSNFITDSLSEISMNRRFLKKTAVPTLNLPLPVKASLQFETVSADVAATLASKIDQPTSHKIENLVKNGSIRFKAMAVSCCIVGCPTVVRHNIKRLFPFPKKESKEYYEWMSACIDSADHIQRLNNPMICPLHFRVGVMQKGKLREGDIPIRCLTPNAINIFKQEIQSVNQLVAEWMILTHQNNPDLVITGAMLKAKAKEVALVMKLHHFDVDLGWLHTFEVYLNLNGIKHWRKRPPSSAIGAEKNGDLESIEQTESTQARRKSDQNLQKIETKEVDEGSVTGECDEDFDVELVESKEESKVAPDSEQSIRTYREALAKVKLLEEYVKRKQNKNAMELVAHMQQILINTLD